MEYIVYKWHMFGLEVYFEVKDNKHQMELREFVSHGQRCREIEFVEIMYRNRERRAFDEQMRIRCRLNEHHERNDEMEQEVEEIDEEKLEYNLNAMDRSIQVWYNE
jgi:hypothetical protein